MTTDLDRALIALRVSRDHGHGAVLNDAEVPALLAEIERLTRERDEAGAENTKLHGWYQEAEQRVKAEQRLSFRAERDALKLLVESTCYALLRAGVTSDNAPDDPGKAIDIIAAERDALAKALAELVACKALKDAGLRSPEDEDAYFRRKPAAWAAARAALAQIEQEKANGTR